MEYAQLNPALTEAIQVTTKGNVEWDATHFCPASALTPEEAPQFRVVPLQTIAPPTVNPNTQKAVRDGNENVAGAWRYKWRVDALTTAELAEKAAAALAATKAAQDAADAATAKADAKVAAIGAMTPAQVKAWVTANVATLADAKDLITTLAVVISILARKL